MNRERFLTHLEIEVRTLDLWLEREWLLPDRTSDALSFSETDVARARLIQDLTKGLGVNDEGVDVVLHLLDQLHGFRRAFEQLHIDLGATRGQGSN